MIDGALPDPALLADLAGGAPDRHDRGKADAEEQDQVPPFEAGFGEPVRYPRPDFGRADGADD